MARISAQVSLYPLCQFPWRIPRRPSSLPWGGFIVMAVVTRVHRKLERGVRIVPIGGRKSPYSSAFIRVHLRPISDEVH